MLIAMEGPKLGDTENSAVKCYLSGWRRLGVQLGMCRIVFKSVTVSVCVASCFVVCRFAVHRF